MTASKLIKWRTCIILNLHSDNIRIYIYIYTYMYIYTAISTGNNCFLKNQPPKSHILRQPRDTSSVDERTSASPHAATATSVTHLPRWGHPPYCVLLAKSRFYSQIQQASRHSPGSLKNSTHKH